MATKLKQLENEGAPKSADGRLARRNYGTGHGYKIDGVKADGVTSIVGMLPKPALIDWAARIVGEWAFDEPQALDHARSMGREAFVEMAKKLPSNDRDKAARRGTEVHKLAELLGRGEEIEVPDELAGHVDAFLDFREKWQPKKEMFEVVVANLQHRYMGTLDCWAHLPALRGMKVQFPEWTDAKGVRRGGLKVLCDHDYECLTIVDYKTSRSGVYSETGLQVGSYGKATHYIDAAGGVREMPKIEHHVSLWIRSDGWELYPFDFMESDFRTFLYLQQILHFADWRNNGRTKTLKGEAMPVPQVAQ